MFESGAGFARACSASLMKGNMNKISIVIPTYNPVKEWFQETLDSCQGVDSIIVCNDASKNFKAEDYKFPVEDVKILHNEKNIGCFKTINRLCSEVKEGFISAQADDDYFDKNSFPHIVDILRKTKADVVYFPCRYFGKYNYVYGYAPNPVFEVLYRDNDIYGASFFRKELFDFLEGFQLEVGADWDFWLRALKSGAKFEFFRLIGAHFRVTERSMFENQLKNMGRAKINSLVHENVNKWDKKLRR